MNFVFHNCFTVSVLKIIIGSIMPDNIFINNNCSHHNVCHFFFFPLVMEIFNSFVDFFFFFIFVIDKNYFYSFWERLISGATYYYKKTEKL